MSENTIFTASTLAIFAAHVAALLAVLLTRQYRWAPPVLVAAVALGVLGYQLFGRRVFAQPVPDWPMLALVGFELAALAVAAAALARMPFAGALAWPVFGLHLLASAGALAFALTFRMDRMI